MLFDTNALSAWAEREPALLRRLPSDRPWYLSSIVLGEYIVGVIRSNRRAALEQWLQEVEDACILLRPDAETAQFYARLCDVTTRSGHVMPYHDLWIGALAQQYRLPILTRDAHFGRIPGVWCLTW